MDDQRRAAAIQRLQKAWTPHNGQKEVGKHLFNSEADMVYVECGRKWGKSEFGVYTCWLKAILTDNAEVFYLAPLVKQARGIVWDNFRMQSCNTYDKQFLADMEKIMGGPIKILNQQMKIELPNGSFIKCDGSDNVDSQRGLKGDLVVSDEYRDFNDRWIEAVRPNMSAKMGKMLFITTPPHGPNHAYDLAEEVKRGMNGGDLHYFYINQPTYTNNRIPGLKEWLEREHNRLIRTGRKNEWDREYMAQFVVSDESGVLPQLNRELIQDDTEIDSKLTSADNKWNWTLCIEPGNSTILGAILAAYDPYTSTVYIVDCLKEWDSNRTSILASFPKIVDMVSKYIDFNKVSVYVSPKCLWFERDWYEFTGEVASLAPDETKRIDYNLNLLKDVAAEGKLVVPERAREVIVECEKWKKMTNGRLPGLDDSPLIQALRYTISVINFTTTLLPRPKQLPADEEWLKMMENPKTVHDTLAQIAADELGIIGGDDLLWAREDYDEDFFNEF